MKRFALIALAALASCNLASAKEACGGSSAKYYDEGLIFHLNSAGVPYRRMEGGGLCVPEKHAAQLKEAERQLDRVFHEIATNPRDLCEERALAEWAQREGLRYELAPSLNSRNEPAGNLFLIRSFTHQELVANREKFRSAPTNSRCKT